MGAPVLQATTQVPAPPPSAHLVVRSWPVFEGGGNFALRKEERFIKEPQAAANRRTHIGTLGLGI